MHHQPNSDGAAPSPDPALLVQRLVLVELVTTPPASGDCVYDLAERLRESIPAIHAATTALAAYGLAHADGRVVFATPAAARFEELWSLKP